MGNSLAVKGTDLVDQNGNPVQLRGISTHNLAWYPEYVNIDAFRTFRDEWGANLIRLALYTDEEGGYCVGGDQKAMEEVVDRGVKAATELGMYVIVDWHILRDETPLKHEEQAKRFLEKASERYASYDNVIYEICNEPNGSETTWADVKGYAERVIPLIRKNAPKAVIIVGTPTWSQDVDLAADDPITGYDNVMYALHYYAATHKDALRAKLTAAREKGLPVFISEFSICDASGNGAVDYESAKEWEALIDKYNLSFAGWNLSNKDESSALIVPENNNVNGGWTDADLSETGRSLKRMIQSRAGKI